MSSPEPNEAPALVLDTLIQDSLGPFQTFVRLNMGPELRSHEAVSDVVQSALRELIRQRDHLTFQSEVAFRAYLFRVAAHKILEKIRYHNALRRSGQVEVRGRTVSDVVEPQATPHEAVARQEEVELLQAAFDELSEEDRTLLSMSRVLGLPTTQIARELERPEATVRYQLGNATARLVEALARRGLRA